MKNNIRILLVDDHQVVREGLKHMLEQEDDMEIVGQSANGSEAMSQVEKLSPNIILMDIKMPGVNGIELTRQIKQKQPYCSIIMLTLYDEYLLQAMEAGATGYLLKDAKRTELTQAIRQVYDGAIVISNNITAKSRAEYEGKFNKDLNHSNELIGSIPEEMQIVIPPPADANQLIKFVNRVEDIFQGNVLQMVGSWKGDTAITIGLPKPTPLEDILGKLNEMPEINTIEEKSMIEKMDQGFFKKVTAMPRPKIRPRKTIFITLHDN
ncbi:MAG: response regulator transcription factor [Dehalococcoidales bacterium]|nr:response regulator transcription factor [Dehalococcoidales bacterium]